MDEQNHLNNVNDKNLSFVSKAVLASNMINLNDGKLKDLVGEVKQLDLAAQLEYIAQKTGSLPIGIDESQKELLLRIFKINTQAMYNYQPKIYPGKIVFFRASEGVLSEMFDFSANWNKLSNQPIECYQVTGDHQSMLTSLHVETLAKYLKSLIDKTKSVINV